MQQYYGLDVTALVLDADEGGWDARYLWRISALLVCLPQGARLRVAECPDDSWDAAAQLLRVLEYDVRALLSAHEDGKPDPAPIPLPSEQAKREEATKQAERDMQDVARALGLI